IGQGGRERGESVAGGQLGQEFAPRTVRRGGTEVVTLAHDHGRALRGRLGGEGADKGRLADAGLARDQDQTALAIRGGSQDHAKSLKLTLPADQDRGWQRVDRGRGEGRRRVHGTSDWSGTCCG